MASVSRVLKHYMARTKAQADGAFDARLKAQPGGPV